MCVCALQGFWVANYVQDAAYYYQYLDSTGGWVLGTVKRRPGCL